MASMKTFLGAGLLTALAMTLLGCGGNSADCAGACSKIYNTCQKVLTDGQGGNLSQAQCVATCNAVAATQRQQGINCILAAECTTAAIGACIL